MIKSDKLDVVALIPARAGSKRVKGKNIRILAGHPLIAYAILAAKESGIFVKVIVSTESKEIAEIAIYYGAEVPFVRPEEMAGDFSPDIEWVEHTLNGLKERGFSYECFSILRPTNPFRKAETIKRAWDIFLAQEGIDSLRAVEKCKQHPGKMWVVRGNRMMPLLPLSSPKQPWHSSQYHSLPEVYVQNASLEIAWSRIVLEERLIAGQVVAPFFTRGNEGFDINDDYDWAMAEELIRTGQASLPFVSKPPYDRNAP